VAELVQNEIDIYLKFDESEEENFRIVQCSDKKP